MVFRYWTVLVVIVSIFITACQQSEPPTAFGPVPTEAQVAWQEMEMNMFVHFNMNTFSDMEWGTGGESPENFNPTNLDTRQWARIAKEAGMKGIILTAKHHDGFCLWPSAYTEHSVKNSPWKNGKGDVVKELSEACREYGLKMGIYLSPWDRNHPDYGKPEYITYFRNQLTELLTNYGEIFEVWFDGANGGSGYYGGANETRNVDRKTYYDWENTYKLIYELQPNAIIFGDGGPGCRWVGNEEGWANPTNWSLLRKDEVYPGYPNYKELRSGHEDGTHWIPAECDVSIRPGWYYHAYEDHKVRTLPELLDIYYNSVGRNGLLLLNFPVDQRGVIHEADAARIAELSSQLKADFAENLARGKQAEATSTRNSSQFSVSNVTDTNPETYWTTEDAITTGSLTIDLKEPTEFNRLVVQENIRLGQRVQQFTLDALVDDRWKEIAAETTIGYKRILRLPSIKASKVRLNILQSKASPVITNIEIYNAPKLLLPPTVQRNKAGLISLKAAEEDVQIYYTLDGSEPDTGANLYQSPFQAEYPVTLKTMVLDGDSQMQSAVTTSALDVSKKDWVIASISSGDNEKAASIIDDDPATWWETDKDANLPQEVSIDLGSTYQISGFTYLPMQARWISGFIQEYEFYVSKDGKTWSLAAKGEFSNILNNPIKQAVTFAPVSGRLIKLKAIKAVEGHTTAGFAEIGIITQ